VLSAEAERDPEHAARAEQRTAEIAERPGEVFDVTNDFEVRDSVNVN
jgi:hypothetical protein